MKCNLGPVGDKNMDVVLSNARAQGYTPHILKDKHTKQEFYFVDVCNDGSYWRAEDAVFKAKSGTYTVPRLVKEND